MSELYDYVAIYMCYHLTFITNVVLTFSYIIEKLQAAEYKSFALK